MYVVYVQTGREVAMIEQLRRKGIAAYSPRQLAAERHRGAWQYVERIIFDGYIFIDDLDAEIWHKVKACHGFLRFVSRCPLSETEDEYVRALCNNGDCISVSRGYVRDGALHITSGFLRKFEHKIVKFNRRGKRATADVTMYGEHHGIVFSVEFDAPPVKM